MRESTQFPSNPSLVDPPPCLPDKGLDECGEERKRRGEKLDHSPIVREKRKAFMRKRGNPKYTWGSIGTWKTEVVSMWKKENLLYVEKELSLHNVESD